MALQGGRAPGARASCPNRSCRTSYNQEPRRSAARRRSAPRPRRTSDRTPRAQARARPCTRPSRSEYLTPRSALVIALVLVARRVLFTLVALLRVEAHAPDHLVNRPALPAGAAAGPRDVAR